MKAYNIVKAADVQALVIEINLRADEDWEAWGIPFMDNDGSMCQLMMKHVQEGLTATDTYNSWAEDDLDDDHSENKSGPTGNRHEDIEGVVYADYQLIFKTGLDQENADNSDDDLDDEHTTDQFGKENLDDTPK